MKLATVFAILVLALSLGVATADQETAGVGTPGHPRPVFSLTGTVISTTDTHLVFGIPRSIVTVETPNGPIAVSCYDRQARRCRTRQAGEVLRITGEIGQGLSQDGLQVQTELFAITVTILRAQ